MKIASIRKIYEISAVKPITEYSKFQRNLTSQYTIAIMDYCLILIYL